MKIHQASAADALLMLLPLTEAGEQIAADMHAAGTGKRCGVCGKPFTPARKWRGIVRLTYGAPDGRMLMVAWLLCGKCNHEAKRNGGKAPECLRREAEELVEAAHLAMTETGGSA